VKPFSLCGGLGWYNTEKLEWKAKSGQATLRDEQKRESKKRPYFSRSLTKLLRFRKTDLSLQEYLPL
jgi:hypothetical protein